MTDRDLCKSCEINIVPAGTELCERCATRKQLQNVVEENKRLREIIFDCEQRWGCECPYCDRDFGKHFNSHADDCAVGQIVAAMVKQRKESP